MSIWLPAFAFALCIALAVAWRFASRRSVERHLRGRETLSEESFAALFSSELEGRVGASVRKQLASWVGFDVALVRPGDELVKHLGLGSMDGLDANEFLACVEREWKVKVPLEEAAGLRTLGQVAAAVARRVHAVQARRNAAALFSPTLPFKPRKAGKTNTA